MRAQFYLYSIWLALLFGVACSQNIGYQAGIGNKSGKEHIWKENDTIEAVAKKYGVSPLVLRMHNGVIEPEDLQPGMTLSIPAKSEQKPARQQPQQQSTSSKLALVWPSKGKITSKYGPRWGRIHYGIDINSKRGRKIRAAAAGRVTFAGRQQGYGLTIILDHGKEVQTLYAHHRTILVKKGQRVKKGATIAIMGNTGRSTGVHLHFELHYKGEAINPMKYLPPRTFASNRQVK